MAQSLLRASLQGGTFVGPRQSPASSSSSSFHGAPCVPKSAPQDSKRRPQAGRASGFDLWKVLGGRGLQAGEVGLKTEKGQAVLFKDGPKEKAKPPPKEKLEVLDGEEEKNFGKELGGLIGGFPGGETGVRTFLEKNPPPKKKGQDFGEAYVGKPGQIRAQSARPSLLMPGMTVVCKKPESVYYMYSGIVQRVTDGRVGVILEGGNWDKLVTFELRDLERTTSGPPGTNPKSKILEKEPVAKKEVAAPKKAAEAKTTEEKQETATAAVGKE